MATYTVTTAAHKTLTANVVDSVTLDLVGSLGTPRVEVMNRGTADPISFTVDGSTPTVLGDNCYVVPAGGALQVSLTPAASGAVKLIAASAVAYSVTEAS